MLPQEPLADKSRLVHGGATLARSSQDSD